MNNQRGSQNYIEKRRWRKKIEVTRRRRGGSKGTDLASNQFRKCSPQPRISKEIQSWVQKRRGKEAIEVTWGRKRRVKKGRGQSSQ